MSEVMPVQVNRLEGFMVDTSAVLQTGGLEAVGEEHQGFPAGSDRGLISAASTPEHVRLRAEKAAALEDHRQPTTWLERNTAPLAVLRIRSRNEQPVSVPGHMVVLDLQHLAQPTPRIKRPDDAVAHRRPGKIMNGGIHPIGGGQQRVLLIKIDAAVSFDLAVGFDRDAVAMKRRRGQDRWRTTAAPIDSVTKHPEHAVYAREDRLTSVDGSILPFLDRSGTRICSRH